MTNVIFRTFKKTGEVIAIFPEILSACNAVECLSYMHLGQHGSCNPAYLINCTTRPATLAEYAPLLRELIAIGYDGINICLRQRYQFVQKRIELVKEYSYRGFGNSPKPPLK